MRSPKFLSLVVLPLALLLGGGVSTAAAAPSSGLQVAGIDSGIDTAYYNQQLDFAKQAGVSFVRTEVRWNALEPDSAGVQDAAYLAKLDAFFQLADAKGLKVVVTMLSTPCWASSAPDDVKKGCGFDTKNTQQVSSWPPSEPSAYADAAALVAGRYGKSLKAFEVWNEPDHSNEFYFAGPDKPQRYAAILKAAYPRIKAASPSTQVLGGAIVGADGKFLKALYAAGIKGSYDALSVHYYDLVLASLRFIRGVQKQNKDSKPLWLGEFGWTSCFPKQKTQDGHNCVTSAVQAQSLTDIFKALRKTSYVSGTVVYQINDNTQYDFGVLSATNAMKPAFKALQSSEKNPGAPRKVSLKLTRRGGQVVATGSGPAGDAYELDVFKGGQFRYKVTFRLDRNLRYAMKVPKQLGTRGLKVRVYQYWLGGGTVKTI